MDQQPTVTFYLRPNTDPGYPRGRVVMWFFREGDPYARRYGHYRTLAAARGRVTKWANRHRQAVRLAIARALLAERP